MGKRWNRLATALLATITVCSTAIGGLTSESRVEAEGVTPVRGTVSNYYVVPNFVYFNNGDMDNQHKMSYHVPDNAPIISPDVSRDTQSLEWAVTFNQNGESWIDGKFFIGLPSEVADPESISIDHNGNTTDFDISNNWNQNKGVIEIADRSEIEKIFTLDKFNNTKSDDNGVDVDDNEMQGRLSLNYDFLKSENLRKVFWFKPEDNKPYVLRFKTRLNTQLSNQRIPVYAGTSDRSGNQANQRVTREKVQAIGLYDTIYCYNHDWVPPKDKTKADYQYLYKGRSNYFDSIAADPMLEDKDILGYVLYLGYPNNESFDGFNLLDTAYTKYPGNGIYSFAQIAQGATQVAVWHLSDEMELDEGKDIHQLAKILIEKAKEMKKAEGPFLDFVKKYNKQAYVYYYDNNNETEIATNTLFQNFVTLKADGPEEIPIDFKVNKIATDGQKLAGARFDIYDGIYPTMDDLSGKTAMLANVSEQQLLSEIKSHHPYTIVETQSPEGYAASKDPVVFQIERMYDLHTVQSNNAKDPTEEPEHFVDTKTNKFRLSILRNIEDTWKWMPEKEIQEVDSQEKLAFELPFVNEAKPFIRTTVQVAGKESTKEKAVEVAYSESQVSVKDKIAYRTLQPNTEYVVFGRLMKVVGEEVNLVKSSVRTFTTGQDLKEASGEIVLDFGDVSLEKDAAYVVYEQVGPKSEAKVSNENNVFQPVLETSDISYPGYTATFDNEENVVKHEDSKDLSQTFVVSSVQTKEVVFSKQDIAGKEIEGAQIELKQGEEVVASWTSKADESHKVKLVAGTYTFHEEAAPNGYLAVTDFTFTVKADGTVELGKTSDAEIKDGKLVVTDQLDKKEVVFSKQDIAGKEIAGAQIELKQGEEVVASWTSKADESHKVKLVPGTYTFHEEASPNGYLAVTDFTFTVKADGTVELGKTSDAEIKDGKLVVTDQLDKKEVVFSKQDIAGKEIEGAQIELKQGKEVVASWTSKAGESHKVKLVPGTYTFHEEAAPNGYLAVTDFTFTVKADGTVELGKTSDAEIKEGKLVVTDQKKPEVPTVTTKKVVFSKQNVAGDEIVGAKIQIKQGDKVVESWTSEAGKSHTVELEPGEYTFHEEAAPNGYLAVTDFTFTVKADGTVELGKTSDAEIKDGKLVVTDQNKPEVPTVTTKKVVFSKQNVAGDEIADAKIQIKQGDKVVESWTSEAGKSHTVELEPGEYTFHEEAAPNGYLAVTDFTFTVKADGTVELGKTSDAKIEDGKLIVTDQVEKKEVVFSKQDIAGKEIEGAQIELKQGEEVVASWTSKAGESHKVKLAPGTYTFHEEAAPNGYLAVADFTFTVKAAGTVELGKTSDAKIEDGKLVVTDQLEKKEVVFSKQNVAGEEISGAKIQIKQGDKVVESWTSEAGKSHTVKLEPGEYTFHEEAAPNGYLAVTDFTFTVKADGTVELGETSDAKIKDGKLVVTDQLDKKEVVFSKQDIAGKEIEGAQIELKQGEEVVASWTSKADESHKVKLVAGTYTFHEEAAPNGYLAVTDFTFTVKADGTVELGKTSDAEIKDGKLVVTDQLDKKEVVFSKQDIAGKEIAGAQIELKQGEEVVASWTSKADESHKVKLVPGTYTFHEEASPNGYLAVTDFTFTVKADGTVELGKTSDAEIKDGKLVVTDQLDKKEVVFSKQDIAGKEIEGAQIELKQGKEVVASWTSKAGESHKVKLVPGTYTFHEEAAPNGYLAVTDFTFTVKADGTVELGETSDAKIKDGKLVVTDQLDKKEVVFSKQDIAGKEIEGAKIELKQGEEVVASWTSKADESHKVKLGSGTYIFHEEAAPNGYLAVTDFTFTVKADGTVELGKTSDAEIKDGKLVVTDQLDKKEVVFSKQDIAGKEIAGAQIELKQGEEVVASWTSKADESHKVKLVAGTYTFHEEAAPNGYLAVTDFTFTVKADGTVELGETSDAKIKDGKLVVTDQKKPEVPTVTTKKVVFSKQNVAGDEIADAKIQIKQGDKVVESWTSEAGKSHTVELEPGEYTFHEEAAPNGYLAVTDFTFTVKAAGTVELGETSDAKIEDGKLVVTGQLDKKEVVFSKQDIAGKEIEGAQIELKQGEEVVASWTSKADESHKVKLGSGTYTFHEEAAPNGYLAVTDFTFTVKADGKVELGKTSDAEIKEGKLVVTDQLDKKEVVFSKQDIAGKEIEGAQIELKQGEEVVASWTSKAGESHKVKLGPGTYTFHEEAAPNGYLAVTDFTFTVKADGTVELGKTSDAEIKDGKLVVTDQNKPEVPTVTTKKVVFSKQNVAGDEIADAKIQIKQGDKVVESWTSEAGKSHTVELEPGEYTFHEEAAPNGYLAVTDFTFTVKADGTVEVSATPDAKVENGKLVVTDQKEPNTPNYVNPREGNLRTTVSANDLTANETHAVNLPSTLSKQVKVVDTIYYTDLVAGESYQLTGALMKITANGQAQTIATQTAKVVADATGTGTWSLNFGTLDLEPGTKYVIFETATSEKPLVDTNKDNQPDAPHVVEHKNPNDLAKTIVVAKEVPTPTPTPVEKGNLRTTVSAANQNGSATKPATITAEQAKKVAVKDTVMYEKLVANQAYQLVGTLMHVEDGKVTPITTQSKDVIADQTGNGQWVLDFGTLTLQSGETYVVYEVATSKEKLVDTNNDGEMDDSQVVEHKNPNDLSQTIVVENEKPTEPTKPQPKEITFSKQNVDGEEIAGAQIQIKQKGKVISEWTSKEGQSHVIKLLPGIYTFHEEAAPNGYLKVTDFEFTISEDGKVSLTGKVSDVSMVNGKLVIVDQRKEIIPPTPTPEPTPEPTPTEPQPKEIIFSKQNVDGEEIAGAKIQIKQKGKVISEWTSEKGQSHVIKLLPGTYTFHEEAAPNGYLKVTDFEFTIDENGKVTVKEGQKDAKIVDGKLVVIDQRKEKTPKDKLKKERKQELPKSGTQAIHPMAGLAMILIGLSVFGVNIRFHKN